MSKRLVSILVTAALVLTAFSLALSRRDSEDWRSSQARRLFPFPWRDVTELRINRAGGEEITLAKADGKGWRIVLPDGTQDSLNPQAVEELAALVMLPWREPLKDADPAAIDATVRLTVAEASGGDIELAFGKLVGDYLSVVVDDEPNVVHGIAPDLAKVLDWPVKRLRNLFLAADSAKRLTRVAVHAGGDADRIEIVRKANAWRLVRPVEWPAEPARVEQLNGWFERLQADAILADGLDDPAAFGFGEDCLALELGFEDEAGPAVRRIEFGDVVPDDDASVYARASDRPSLFKIAKQTLEEIALWQAVEFPDVWADYYRLRTLDLLGPPPSRRIVVERLLPRPERLTLDRAGDAGTDVRWTGVLEKDGETLAVAVDPPSPDDPLRPMTRLLTGLSGLRVRSFLADVPPGPDTVKWTAYPAWRFTVTGADGAQLPAVTLYSNNAEGTFSPDPPGVDARAASADSLPEKPGERPGVVASIADRPAILDLFGDMAYLLCLPPFRYQSRWLLDYNPSTWQTVEITRQGKTVTFTRRSQEYGGHWWRSGEPAEPLFDDNNRFLAMLADLSQMHATAIVDSGDGDPAEFGLDQPEITVIVYGTLETAQGGDAGTEPGELFALSIGGAVGDPFGSRFARLNDKGIVFRVSPELVEALTTEYR